MKKIRHTHLLIIFFGIMGFGAIVYGYVVTGGYRIQLYQQDTITAHGVCKKVQNMFSNSDIFVPTNSSTEWQAFLNNTPYYVGLSNCGPTLCRYNSDCTSVPATPICNGYVPEDSGGGYCGGGTYAVQRFYWHLNHSSLDESINQAKSEYDCIDQISYSPPSQPRYQPTQYGQTSDPSTIGWQGVLLPSCDSAGSYRTSGYGTVWREALPDGTDTYLCSNLTDKSPCISKGCSWTEPFFTLEVMGQCQSY